MKVYVLIGGWDYEGNDEPEGVYSTKEKAEEAKAHAYDGYSDIEILEYDIDDEPRWVKRCRPAKPGETRAERPDHCPNCQAGDWAIRHAIFEYPVQELHKRQCQVCGYLLSVEIAPLPSPASGVTG